MVTSQDSVVLSQIHPRVQARNLIAVAVEQLRFPHEELADAPLGALIAKCRARATRVHIRVERVILRYRDLPARRGLFLDEPDLHDRFDALEAVLPRHDEPDR